MDPHMNADKRRWKKAALYVVIVGLVVVGSWAWFAPSGSGEFADSPDGRYRVHVSNLRRGTWLRGREAYIGIKIDERASGRTVWSAQRYPHPLETPPEFGSRWESFITWAPDSRSVAIPVGGSADIILLVE